MLTKSVKTLGSQIARLPQDSTLAQISELDQPIRHYFASAKSLHLDDIPGVGLGEAFGRRRKHEDISETATRRRRVGGGALQTAKRKVKDTGSLLITKTAKLLKRLGMDKVGLSDTADKST